MLFQRITSRVLGSSLILFTFLLFGVGYCLTSAAADLALTATAVCVNERTAQCFSKTVNVARAKYKQTLPDSLKNKLELPGSVKDEQAIQERVGAFNSMLLYFVVTDAGHLSLRLPLACFIVALLSLGVGVGLVLHGDAYGMLLDANTGCASLSRTQAFLWTAIIMGGYTVMALFNLFLGAHSVASSIDLYPTLDKTLLTLLGIVAASPVAATYISKQTTTNKCPAASGLQGSFIRFAELFTDDAAGVAPPLTISRMQCVLITLTLATCYLAILMQSVSIPDVSIIMKTYIQKPFFQQLPETGESFLTLLIASHVIFQGSKSKVIEKIFTTG